MITSRDLAILLAVARYYTLTRAQIQFLCFPAGVDGRIVRKRLLHLVNDVLLAKTAMQVVNPSMGAPAPVYFPTRKGCEFLAAELKDDRYLSVCTQTPTWQHLYHWTQVAQFHVLLDQALARQQEVQLEGWLSEWDVANPQEKEPENHFKLYTLIRAQPRLVANPDAGFLLSCRGFRKVYYLELDRATSGIQQIANSKPAGFAAMAEEQLHRRHFPEANVDSFAVLLVTPTPQRRDALRKAFSPRPGAALWKFSSWTDVTAEKLLHEPVFYPCTGEPAPLVKLPREGS